MFFVPQVLTGRLGSLLVAKACILLVGKGSNRTDQFLNRAEHLSTQVPRAKHQMTTKINIFHS